jgi:hypothetical protein
MDHHRNKSMRNTQTIINKTKTEVKMKTLRFSFIAILMSMALLANANTSMHDLNKMSIGIALEDAIKNPELVRSMYDQLDDDFLRYYAKGYIIKKGVVHENIIYIISGSHEEWTLFFLMDSSPEKPCRKKGSSPGK